MSRTAAHPGAPTSSYQRAANGVQSPDAVPQTFGSQSSVPLRYLEKSPIQVRGPVTGRRYEFSGAHPVQAVDPGDAAALLRTRFFQQA